MKAYRLFYRARKGYMDHRQELVWGEAELERCLARQRPAVIHHEVAVLWKCAECGKRGPWDKGWRSMPGRAGPAGGWGDPTQVCSKECAERWRPGYQHPHWMNSDREPTPTHRKKLMKARWTAFMAERDRVSDLRSHRSVPMLHKGKGNGWCRWCGDPVQKPRLTWHEGCLREYNRHTNHYAQGRFLRDRDGPLCRADGCDQPGEEVDHVIPLWKVRHLPDAERRAYFGPANLQLLCSDHHKAKTAREAGERAKAALDRDRQQGSD